MGFVLLYQTSQPGSSIWDPSAIIFDLPYFSISLSLNILLTSMIVVRLLVHRRNIVKAAGVSAGAGRLYDVIITVLIESSALYAASSLLFVGLWGGARNHVGNIFLPALAEVQVRSFSLSAVALGDNYLVIMMARESLRSS